MLAVASSLDKAREGDPKSLKKPHQIPMKSGENSIALPAFILVLRPPAVWSSGLDSASQASSEAAPQFFYLRGSFAGPDAGTPLGGRAASGLLLAASDRSTCSVSKTWLPGHGHPQHVAALLRKAAC